AGADPVRVTKELRTKLDCDAILMQLPIGRGADFEGVVDLISRRSLYFDGENGERVREENIPDEMVDSVRRARNHLLEGLAMYSDELMEMLLVEKEVPIELIHDVIKAAVGQQLLTPVFLGSAYRNKGVQPLLDAVASYLPSPLETEVFAMKPDNPDEKIPLLPDPDKPTVAMAFKITEDPYGALTFMRIYQGQFLKGGSYYNQRTGRKDRFSRLVRMHADQREDVDRATAGDIVAVLGVDCASGDTYASENAYCTLQQMFVPEPVIKMAIRATARDGADRLSKALYRFRREDPTLRISSDEETGETLMAGMGELHLEVYVERIRREYGVAVEVGRPKVNYREAPTQATTFDIRHKKQTGGSGQFAHIKGQMRPLTEEDEEHVFKFEEHVVGGRIPKQYIPAVEKGLRAMLNKGTVAGFPIVGLHVTLDDGSFHEVDSSDLAFQTAAKTAMREVFPKTRPVLLEPVMKIEIECPQEFQGSVVGDLTSRRGMILGTSTDGPTTRIEGEVPLAETFGYSTDLRSMSQGQGTFSMEFVRYKRLPASLEREVIADRKTGTTVGAM
ncbi:MAG: elongation factor G, partial [Pirellulales bacterium]|nr:elongation factor G [Pirellulales bacterium]